MPVYRAACVWLVVTHMALLTMPVAPGAPLMLEVEWLLFELAVLAGCLAAFLRPRVGSWLRAVRDSALERVQLGETRAVRLEREDRAVAPPAAIRNRAVEVPRGVGNQLPLGSSPTFKRVQQSQPRAVGPNREDGTVV